MQRSFEEEFATKVIDAPYWRRFLASIGLRLRKLEQIVIDWEVVKTQGLTVLLQRLNEVLIPAAQRIQDLTSLGWLIAPSSTVVTLEEGEVATFEIPAGVKRDLFSPSPFLAITREDNPDDFAVARLLSYVRATGVIDVLVERVEGNPGPHGDWQIAAVAGSVLAQMSMLDEAGDRLAAVQALQATYQGYVAQTAADRVATGQDRVATGLDKTDTAADRVQTGLDRMAAAQSAAQAAMFNPATYAPKASPAFTGNPTAPTPVAGDADTSIATTAFVATAIDAARTSPALIGNPTAPTQAPGDADTSIATTGFVAAALTALEAVANTWTAKQTFDTRVDLAPATLTVNTGACDFSARNIYNISMTAATTLAVTNLTDGQDGYVNLTSYTGGALTITGVDRWVKGDDNAAQTTFAGTAVGTKGLASGGRYQFAFSRIGGATIGRVSRVY